VNDPRLRVYAPDFEGKRQSVRVGLVLGAGGVLGGAWLTGALSALARETYWDPGSAEHVVGTSAGSMIGALVAAGAVLDLIPAIARRASRARLEREERKVRRFGTEVVIIEPNAEDHAAMERNSISADRRQDVIETAERTVAEQLRDAELCARLASLPKGEPHTISRPSGPPSSWPEVRPAARRAA